VDTINNALQHSAVGYTGCGANTYVQLAGTHASPATFNLSGGTTGSNGIDFASISNDLLRGGGGDATLLVFGTGMDKNCNGGANTAICIQGAHGEYPNGNTGTTYPWTAGYAQGSNQITITGGPAAITLNSTIIVMDQDDDGYTGDPAVGIAIDTGNYFNCGDVYGELGNGNAQTVNTSGTSVTWNSGVQFTTTWLSGGGTLQYNINGTIYTVATIPSATSMTLTTSAGTQTNVNAYPVAGCAVNGPDGGNGRVHRFQVEMSQATAYNSATGVITLANPLKHPNWRSGQSPEIWLIQPVMNDGVENLSIDLSGDSSANDGIAFINAYNVWASGVRVIKPVQYALHAEDVDHFTWQSNYAFAAQTASGTDSSIAHVTQVGDGLVQNNISEQYLTHFFGEGPDSGTVVGYNFFISDNVTSGNMNQSHRPHSNGNDYVLDEGNVSNGYYGENIHGSSPMHTDFRNFYTGWESCGTSGTCGGAGSKSFGTVPVWLEAYSGRYANIIADVLGTPGYHTTYTTASASTGIYELGNGNNNFTPNVPTDPLTSSTLVRWGNYDVVNTAVLECTALNTPIAACTADERGDAAPTYPGLSSPATTFPASFYLSAKPSWWGTMPYPAIGPDVSSGNLGQCSGTLNVANQYNGVAALSNSQCGSHGITASAWGGHVNANPAMTCYLNTMGGPPDGSNASALSFNANTCYQGNPANPGTSKAPGLTLTPGISVTELHLPAHFHAHP
jgi:hypothetical protein